MWTVLLTSMLAVGPVVQGAAPDDPFALMEQLASLELSEDDIYRVRDLTLRRDAVSVAFERGVLAFLEPVNGKVTGAVFVGAGDVLALPPDEVERRQVDKFTGSPILNERFDAAILRFTDDTYEEVVATIALRSQEDLRSDDLEALLPWGQNLGSTSRLLNNRLLQDLMVSSDRPIFFAALRGERLGWFDVAYDERNTEEIIIGDSAGSSVEGQVQNVWASFNRRAEARDRSLYGRESQSDLDVIGYRLETEISGDGQLGATATVDVRVVRGGERVLPFDLSRALRLSAVRFAGQSIPFFQHDALPPGPGSSAMDRFVVVLPEVTVAGEEIRFEFDYGGSVLERRGNGVYYVNERVFWYPHVGHLDPASYDLTFHYPEDKVLVATGRLEEEWEADGVRHSRWVSGSEFAVAGFNYGDFSVEVDRQGDVPIYVHVNNDVETVYEDLAIRRAAVTERVLRELQGARRGRGGSDARVPVQAEPGLFSTRRLASNVAERVRSMLDFFSNRLGDYPFARLSVTQFPMSFSQGWPSLLYVSTLSFFDEEQRQRLGVSDREDLMDPEFVLAHEVAHQWFGNKVIWNSYRDQWIDEGFANYMAILYLEASESDGSSAQRELDRLREDLVANLGGGRTRDDNGPVWLGQRLSTRSSPNGYVETIYPKATWIIHMLRMLLREGGETSDERFISMLREYLSEFEGGAATTWDLKNVTERYMTPRMDVEGDGSLDWFFDQWIFGTGIPDYGLTYEVGELNPGRFVVSGTIRDRAGLRFRVPLPLYAETRAGEVRYIGDVVASGETTPFELVLDFLPGQVLMDPYGAVLRR